MRVKKNCRSLEYAIDFLKIEKTESFHRALHDAWYTAEVFAKLPIEVVEKNYSIDTYQNPKSKKEEIHVMFENYSNIFQENFQQKKTQ